MRPPITRTFIQAFASSRQPEPGRHRPNRRRGGARRLVGLLVRIRPLPSGEAAVQSPLEEQVSLDRIPGGVGR